MRPRRRNVGTERPARAARLIAGRHRRSVVDARRHSRRRRRAPARRRRRRPRPPRPSRWTSDRRIAIGESVMLGAKSQLEAKGFIVDAAESRQGKEVVDVMARLRAAGQLGQHRRDPHRHQRRGLRRDVRGDHGQPAARGGQDGVVPHRATPIGRGSTATTRASSPCRASTPMSGSATGPTSCRTSRACRTTASTSRPTRRSRRTPTSSLDGR